MTASAAPMRAWLPSLAIAAAGWGSSFLFIKISLRGFNPAHVGFGRLAVGAVVLLAIVAAFKSWPHFGWKAVGAIALTAIGMSVVPMVLIPMAEQQITSILASLLNATTPLWTALFVALLIPAERTTRAQLVGLIVGAGGIAVLVGAWDVQEFSLKGTILMLTATAFYGVGGAMSRMLLGRVSARPETLAMTQVGLSALILAPVALVSGSPQEGAFSPSGSALWGLLALGVFGTSFAYVMFWRVVKMAGATTAASVTYLVPIVATTLGILVLGETLHWYEPVGVAIVLAGVWLAGRTPRVGVHPRIAEPAGAPEADLA